MKLRPILPAALGWLGLIGVCVLPLTARALPSLVDTVDLSPGPDPTGYNGLVLDPSTHRLYVPGLGNGGANDATAGQDHRHQHRDHHRKRRQRQVQQRRRIRAEPVRH